MKIPLSLKTRRKAGYALLMVLMIAGTSLLVLAGTMERATSATKLNARSNQFVANQNAAEAATEKVVAQMRVDFRNGGDLAVADHTSIYRTSIPSGAEDDFWSNFQFNDASGNIGRNYVNIISNKVYTPLQSQYYGLSGWRTVYRVLSNVKSTTSPYEVQGAVQQDVEFDSIPIFQYAIFYNSLLEFTWAAPLVVRGRTHANANIYTGSSASLTFYDLVTASGVIIKKSWAGFTVNQMTGSINFNGSPGYRTNVPVLSLPIGTNNTASAVREILNVPPTGESVTSAMGQERYYNKAGMVLLVSNTTVTAIIKDSAADSAPVIITSTNTPAALQTNFPFLSLSTSFTDQRENKTIKPAQLDVGVFSNWASTNVYTSPTSSLTKHPSSNPLNILYVLNAQSTSSAEMAAIRLTNGAALPTNPGASGQNTGLSIATPNPLYVLGNYNCPNSAYLNTTNTSQSVPASLVSDALTVLSQNWRDSASASSFTTRPAINTTINAAIVTGIVYSDGSNGTSPFSGGVMNLPRLLEDWGNGSRKLTLNTSIVSLFNSVVATAPFQNPGYYYYAPTRDFNFDSNFKDQTRLPPGTPSLGVVLRAKWAAPPPGTVNYAGN